MKFLTVKKIIRGWSPNKKDFSSTLEENPLWWYAAVMDLTPTYGFKEDCMLWHRNCHKACIEANDHNYEHYKKACDNYYYLKHRKEHRGIGGLWVEYYQKGNINQSAKLIKSIGQHFAPSYEAIVKKRAQMPYDKKEKSFQNQRRARYCEFNLLYDRGTRFGLEFGSNIDAIFVSLPPSASWQIDNQHTKEAKTLQDEFLTPKNWLEETITP